MCLYSFKKTSANDHFNHNKLCFISDNKMTAALHLITFDNEVFRAYVFWVCVLCLKMMLMAALTAYHRVATNV